MEAAKKQLMPAQKTQTNFKQKLQAKIKIIFDEVFLEARRRPVAQGIVLKLERPEDHLLLPKTAPCGPGTNLVCTRLQRPRKGTKTKHLSLHTSTITCKARGWLV